MSNVEKARALGEKHVSTGQGPSKASDFNDWRQKKAYDAVYNGGKKE